MGPVARLREARRLVAPEAHVEHELVVEARLLAAWLAARRLAERRPSVAHDLAAAEAFTAYRAQLLQRIPRAR